MTKILDVTTGNFVPLVSSVEWDKNHKGQPNDLVLDIENSFRYEVYLRDIGGDKKAILAITIESFLERLDKDSKAIYEIVYD
jgi:hypothetical protein